MDGVNRGVISRLTESPGGEWHNRDPRRLNGSAAKGQIGLSGRRSRAVAAPVLARALIGESGEPATSLRLTRREAEVLGLLARRLDGQGDRGGAWRSARGRRWATSPPSAPSSGRATGARREPSRRGFWPEASVVAARLAGRPSRPPAPSAAQRPHEIR